MYQGREGFGKGLAAGRVTAMLLGLMRLGPVGLGRMPAGLGRIPAGLGRILERH